MFTITIQFVYSHDKSYTHSEAQWAPGSYQITLIYKYSTCHSFWGGWSVHKSGHPLWAGTRIPGKEGGTQSRFPPKTHAKGQSHVTDAAAHMLHCYTVQPPSSRSTTQCRVNSIISSSSWMWWLGWHSDPRWGVLGQDFPPKYTPKVRVMWLMPLHACYTILPRHPATCTHAQSITSHLGIVTTLAATRV